MATLTLSTIRSLIRDELNEPATTTLTNTELNSIINDGYKDVCTKGVAYENKISFTNISVSQKIVPLVFATNRIIRVNYVEYKLGTTDGGLGMLPVLPQTVGHSGINDNTPQYWFQWGDYLVVEPLPDVGTYDLAVYASCLPSAVISSDSGTPSNLPDEFHESVFLFALAFSCLKLKRWGDFANSYNRYIFDVQRKKNEYITKYPDGRYAHELPNNVTMEQPNGR
jgi:hypothetical protein